MSGAAFEVAFLISPPGALAEQAGAMRLESGLERQHQTHVGPMMYTLETW